METAAGWGAATELVVCATGIGVAYCGFKRKWGRLPRLLAWGAALPAFLALPGHIASPIARGLVAFMLCWICPSKLLLLCFDQPLDAPASWLTSNFSHFLSASLLPIQVRPVSTSSPQNARSLLTAVVSYTIASVSLFNLCFRYPYPLLYVATIYTNIELSHAAYTLFMHAVYHVDLLPAFNHPFTAASLSSFWGRCWNLTATSLLRATVYQPILRLLNGYNKVPIPTATRVVALCATFATSGLIHELIFYHITQAKAPSWEVMAFFLVHGMATSIEVVLRRALKGRRVILRAVSVALTQGFLYMTAVWLFLPPLCAAYFFS